MAFKLLDGTLGTIDLTIAMAGGTSGTSARCVINSMQYRSVRGFQSRKTLCSGKWESEAPGTNQDFITGVKFASEGSLISDFSPLLTATASASTVFSLSAGTTKSGTFWLDGESNTVNAGQVAIPGTFSLRSDGPVATASVTS
jgi:hypothetical protein